MKKDQNKNESPITTGVMIVVMIICIASFSSMPKLGFGGAIILTVLAVGIAGYATASMEHKEPEE